MICRILDLKDTVYFEKWHLWPADNLVRQRFPVSNMK